MRRHFFLIFKYLTFVCLIGIYPTNMGYASGPYVSLVEQQSEQDSINYIANLWKQDSVGCLNIRTKYVGFIKKNLPIKTYTLYNTLLLFGEPNLLYINEGKFMDENGDLNVEKCIYIVYYYNSVCKDGKFDYEVKDRPLIIFVFSSNGKGLMIR